MSDALRELSLNPPHGYQSCDDDVHWITRMNQWAWSNRAKPLWDALSEMLWIERIRLWSLDVRQGSRHEEVGAMGGGLSLAFGDGETLQRILADRELDIRQSDRDYYHHLIDRGDRLFVGSVGDRIVFFGFAVFGQKRMYTQYFALGEHEFFVMRCFTHPAYRGMGIYPRAVRFLCSALARESFTRGFIDVATHNRPSIRGVRKAGALPLHTYYERFRLAGRDFVIPHGPLKRRFLSP